MMQKSIPVTHRTVHISMHAYDGENVRTNCEFQKLGRPPLRNCSKRMGMKEGRKLAENRIFSYLVPLSILPQKKVSQHFSMGPNVYLSFPKKPPSQSEVMSRLFQESLGGTTTPGRAFTSALGSHSFLTACSSDGLPVSTF